MGDLSRPPVRGFPDSAPFKRLSGASEVFNGLVWGGWVGAGLLGASGARVWVLLGGAWSGVPLGFLLVRLSELGARGFLLLLPCALPTVRSSRAAFNASVSFAAPLSPAFPAIVS